MKSERDNGASKLHIDDVRPCDELKRWASSALSTNCLLMLTLMHSDLAVVVVCLRWLASLLDAQDTHLNLNSVLQSPEGFIRYILQKYVADDFYNNSTKMSSYAPLVPSIIDTTTGNDIDEHLKLLLGYNIPVLFPRKGAIWEEIGFHHESLRTSCGWSGIVPGGALFHASNPLHVSGKMVFVKFEEDAPSTITCHSRML